MKKYVIIDKDVYRDIIAHLERLEKKINNIRSKEPIEKEWLTSEEVMEIFDICDRTLQNWRDKGVIGFSKINNRTYYDRDDVKALLRNSYHPAF